MTVKEETIPETDSIGSDSGELESANAKAADAAETDSGDSPDDKPKAKTSGGRRLSISIRSLVITMVITILAVGVSVAAWLYVGARDKLAEQSRQSENAAHAEKVALEYAVNAAAMNYQDLNAWRAKLVAGTSPELKDKLGRAATSMEQILVPLQWTSTASPLVAKVVSKSGGAYVVDSFVSVLTKTMQSPEPLRSTATYSVTIDSNKGWQISDVGGIGAAVDQK